MPAAGIELLYPLDLAYERAGLAPPDVCRIEADEIPEPYHSLLVHTNDMTRTLEQHYRGPVVVRALATFSTDGQYFRRVLLSHASSGRPVEMGAIRINLDCLAEPDRARVLENRAPLGRVLVDAGIVETTRPVAFLRVTPNPEMMGVFWMRDADALYGRRTSIDIGTCDVADVVEILPPAWSPDA